MAVLPALALLAGLATITSNFFGQRYSIAAVFAVATSAMLLGLLALTRKRMPRAGASAAGHALVWVPAILFGAGEKLDTMIVYGPPSRMNCGTGLMALLMVAVPMGAVVLVALGVALSFLFSRRGADLAIRYLAVGATSLAVLASALAIARGNRPESDGFTATFPIIAELQAGEKRTILGQDVHYESVDRMGPSLNIPEDGSPPAIVKVGQECKVTGVEISAGYSFQGECSKLYFRHDVQGGYLFVEERYPGAAGTSMRAAFAVKDGRVDGLPISVSSRSMGPRLRPPIGWTVGGASTGVFAVVLLVLAARARRKARGIAGVEAVHVGMGLVELPNGETTRVTAAEQLPTGSVVLRDEGTSATAYREVGTTTFSVAEPGTLEELRGRVTDLAVSLEAVAAASASLGLAPLVIARMWGLL